MKNTIIEINAKIRELAEYTAMAKELEATQEALKDEIKAYMKEAGTDELLGANGEHIIWKEVVSSRFNSTAFKEAGYKELFEQFCKPMKTKPFKIFA